MEFDDEDTCTLILQDTFLTDAGTYTCQASNLLGRISCDSHIGVERKSCFLFF